MRIYRGRIEPAVEEIVHTLLKEELVEIDPKDLEEVKKDLESVLSEYLRQEREIAERAKDIVAKQNMSYSSIGKVKRSLAREKSFGIEDEALDYIVQQMIEIMLSSSYVEEVYGQDHDINRVVAPIITKYMVSIEEELENEVKQQLKHLESSEGTQLYENEYSRVRGKLESLKKLR